MINDLILFVILIQNKYFNFSIQLYFILFLVISVFLKIKKRDYDTQASQIVPYFSTNCAFSRLTSEV